MLKLIDPNNIPLPFQFPPTFSLLLPALLRSFSSQVSSTITPFNSEKSDPSIEIDLVLSYFDHGEISTARYLFQILFRNSTQLLNSRIRELSISGFFEKIIHLYGFLRFCDIKPDNWTFPHVLKACTSLLTRREGESIHSQIIRYGFCFDVIVVNSLMDMYCKFGSLQSAQQLFDKMPERNLISWNSMISGYRLNGFPDLALELCSLMRFEGLRLDRISLMIVLPLCGQLGALQLGKSAHAYVISLGLSSDLVLLTSIIDMYAKCGEMSTAEKIFDKTSSKDVITWNTMISGYSKIGKSEMVLKFFHKMQVENLAPTVVSALIVLQSCADLAVSRTGEIIHGYIIKVGLGLDASIETLLIDVYSKCGRLDLACRVFNGMYRGNVKNAWSAMISGLGKHGYGRFSLMFFFKMLQKGVDPDGVCFLLVLSACSHARLVNDGRKFFYYMINQFEIQPEMEHYVSMVDLLGRAGFLEEAFRFICQMPIEPDISLWGAFLGSCRIYSDFEAGKAFEERIIELGPSTAGYYMILLDIQAAKGNWDEVIKIRNLIKERRVKKTRGHSLIEINS